MARLLICSSRISCHNSPCRFPKMFTQLLKYVALTWYIFLYFRSEACKSLCAKYFWMKLLEMTTFLQMMFLSANKFEIHWNDKLRFFTWNIPYAIDFQIIDHISGNKSVMYKLAYNFHPFMCTVAKSRYVDSNDSKSIQFAKNIFLLHKNSLGHVMENIDSLQWYIFPTFLWLGR